MFGIAPLGDRVCCCCRADFGGDSSASLIGGEAGSGNCKDGICDGNDKPPAAFRAALVVTACSKGVVILEPGLDCIAGYGDETPEAPYCAACVKNGHAVWCARRRAEVQIYQSNYQCQRMQLIMLHWKMYHKLPLSRVKSTFLKCFRSSL